MVDFSDVAEATRRSMLANKGKDTKPELVVRRLTHAMGYRYRLHRRNLPGTPDLVFGPRRKVVFVHGCFWHGHGCSNQAAPKTRAEYWRAKFRRNTERDALHEARLRALGWTCLIIWECETKKAEDVAHRVRSFLDG